MTKLNSDVDPKLSDVVIQQLQRKRVCTVIQFIEEDSEKLATCTGLSLKDILDLKRNISQKYGGVMRNALDLLEIEESNIIPTDLPCLDNLLKGGLYPGQMYEVCGISSSGKTQLCLTIASNVALKPNNLIRYIDTKRDFCGSRVEQILLEKNCDKQIVHETMERIKVCNVLNGHQLFKVLRWLKVALKEETDECRTRIIIIDSLPGVIFKSSKEHNITIALNHLANICHFIANEFRLSIINVNLITQWNSDENGSSSTSSNENHSNVIATLGKYWSRVPNTRLLIEKMGLGNRKISIWKSFQLEENCSCFIGISGCGVLCI